MFWLGVLAGVVATVIVVAVAGTIMVIKGMEES